jgi:hypothetical protein
MKVDFRVWTCLALLASVAACSRATEAPTSPTSAISGGTNAAADGTTLKATAPALVAPLNDVRVTERRPTLIWANSTGKYGSIGMAYDIEVSTTTTVVYSTTVGETPDFGQHTLPFDVEYDADYFWRSRARLGDMFGPWSDWAQFKGPVRPAPVAPTPTPTSTTGGAACAAPLSPLQPGEIRRPRPNELRLVELIAGAYPAALRNSCQEHGGSWEFMDRLTDALRAKDGRWGYNCKRGNCNDPSLDVVSYYYQNGTDIQGKFEVYIFDVIGQHCGAIPFAVWNDVTDITYSQGTVGRTMYPRPGRTVPTCQ